MERLSRAAPQGLQQDEVGEDRQQQGPGRSKEEKELMHPVEKAMTVFIVAVFLVAFGYGIVVFVTQ